MQVELKKMATEGYIFAKLPKCYLMPQLRDWIMYRQSVTFSETDKSNLFAKNTISKFLIFLRNFLSFFKFLIFYLLYIIGSFPNFLENLMQATVYTWQLLKKRTPKIKQPSLPMMEHQKKLTYKQAKEIKEKVNNIVDINYQCKYLRIQV